MPGLIWFLILLAVASIGTFSLRFSFIALLGKIQEPAWFRRSLKYIPAAVMGALVSSSLFIRNGQLVSWDNPRIWAAACAAIVGYFTKSLLWTILSGLVALFTLTHLIGLGS